MTRREEDDWLSTDERRELLNAIETAASFAEQIKEDPYQWKWLIIAMHSSLQGAFVCALRGADTSGINVLTPTSAKEWMKWYELPNHDVTKASAPEERLASMTELYKRSSDANYLRDAALPPNDDWNDAVKVLNFYRNQFVHFVPQSVSFALAGMASRMKRCCDIIEHLTLTHSTFWHQIDDNKKQALAVALRRIRSAMQSL